MLIPLSYLPFSVYLTSRKFFIWFHIPQNSQDHNLWYLCVFACNSKTNFSFSPQLEASNLKNEKSVLPKYAELGRGLLFSSLFGHCTAALMLGSFPAEGPAEVVLSRMKEVLPSQQTTYKCGTVLSNTCSD